MMSQMCRRKHISCHGMLVPIPALEETPIMIYDNKDRDWLFDFAYYTDRLLTPHFKIES